jgi:hypothetical protein
MSDTTMNPMTRGISFGVGVVVTFLVVYLLDSFIFQKISPIITSLLPFGVFLFVAFDFVCILISAFIGAWWGRHISRKGWIGLGLITSTLIGVVSALLISILFSGTTGQWLLGTVAGHNPFVALLSNLSLVILFLVIFWGFMIMIGSREMGGPFGILLGMLLIHGMPLIVLFFMLGIAPSAEPGLKRYLMSAASFSLSYWLTAIAASIGL